MFHCIICENGILKKFLCKSYISREENVIKKQLTLENFLSVNVVINALEVYYGKIFSDITG